MLKALYVTMEHHTNWDEMWAPFFKCPNTDCQCQDIIPSFAYCPHCGNLLEWAPEVDEKIYRKEF